MKTVFMVTLPSELPFSFFIIDARANFFWKNWGSFEPAPPPNKKTKNYRPIGNHPSICSAEAA